MRSPTRLALAANAIAVAMVSCGGPTAKPTRATTPTESIETPPAEHPIRDLDTASYTELKKAFADNPVAARATYSNVRWRLSGEVQRISESGSVQIHVRHVGPMRVSLPDTEIVKLKRGHSAAIVAYLENIGVDWSDRSNAQFKAGGVAEH